MTKPALTPAALAVIWIEVAEEAGLRDREQASGRKPVEDVWGREVVEEPGVWREDELGDGFLEAWVAASRRGSMTARRRSSLPEIKSDS